MPFLREGGLGECGFSNEFNRLTHGVGDRGVASPVAYSTFERAEEKQYGADYRPCNASSERREQKLIPKGALDHVLSLLNKRASRLGGHALQ